jgi:hypothetical protein
MNLITCFVAFAIIAIPFQPISAKPLVRNEVVITASGVDGANDIEAAIIDATAGGTRPGTVILDGVDGAFVFTNPDKSLNIFVSNLTLRGINQAILDNCVDGLFFDDFALQNILVEGITFLCTGGGVEATGQFMDVTLRDNVFWVGANGIGGDGHFSDWLIEDNYIQAGADAIVLSGAQGVLIKGNQLSGNNGVVLRRNTQFRVQRNVINSQSSGIVLAEEAWDNLVQGNMIIGVGDAGIALEPGVTGNRILANRVRCALGSACLTVDALPYVLASNKVAGNKP